MIKENAVAGVNTIGFPIIYGNPVGIHLRYSVGATRVERGGFFLWRFLHESIEFGCGRLIKACLLLQAKNANSLKNTQCTKPVSIGGVLWGFKADRHMAHRCQVIDFVRLNLLDDPNKVGRVRQIAIVQDKVLVIDMRILVQMINTIGIKKR